MRYYNAGFALAFLLFLALAGGVHRALSLATETRRWIIHTGEVLDTIALLQTDVMNQSPAAHETLTRLRRETSDNAAQQQNCAVLEAALGGGVQGGASIILNSMRAEESRLLRERAARGMATPSVIRAVAIALTLFNAVALLLLYVAVRRLYTAKARAHEANAILRGRIQQLTGVDVAGDYLEKERSVRETALQAMNEAQAVLQGV